MDAQAPIRTAVRASIRFGGLRAPADVVLDVCGGATLSVIRGCTPHFDIPTLQADQGTRVGLWPERFGRATTQGGVVPEKTATSMATNGIHTEPYLGGNGAQRGSVHKLKLYERRKRWP